MGCQVGGRWEVGPELGAECLGPVREGRKFPPQSGSSMGTG